MDLLGSANKALRRVLIARGMASGFALGRGHPVHYYSLHGERAGTPIVLLHGLGGSANGFYKTFFALAKRFGRVIAPDLPGNGFSPLPSTGPLTMIEQLGVLNSFVDEVVPEPFFLVGNSLGGAMSVALAHAAPQRLKALGLVSPAGARVSDERTAELLTTLGKVETTAQARAITRRLFHRAPVAMLLLSSEMRKMYGTPAVRHLFSEARASDCLEPTMLSSLAMPTLLVWGASEKLLPYEGVDYFRKHLPPHAQIEVVKGFGHIPQMERPAELVKLLVRFADDSQL